MVDISIRKAIADDAGELTGLLNEIIAAGGTTAIEVALSPAEFREWFIDGPSVFACHVAETDNGLAGFQEISRYGDLPDGWADIGTFSRKHPKIPGVGTALFAATLAAARSLDMEFINATIRADNTGGLAYYAKMGFETYGITKDAPLLDGTPVDRINKRFQVNGR
ncbi:L-amino acid N-acyltransferase YncA [Rhizobium sp. BE258]|nr:L-amino acid N-acyltransferase YncA [Rhizobium sp. BE258]